MHEPWGSPAWNRPLRDARGTRHAAPDALLGWLAAPLVGTLSFGWLTSLWKRLIVNIRIKVHISQELHDAARSLPFSGTLVR